MPTLYVENVPEDVYEALRARAQGNGKSISAEVLALLAENVPTPAELARRREVVDRICKIRIPIGNERSMRTEVRAVAPDANPYLVMYSIFKTGLEGSTAKIKNLRQAERYLPDNIYTAIENFRNADWSTKMLGEDVKTRYADLKQASADRCPRLLGAVVKPSEVQFHHEVYNQFLWNLF